MSRRGYILLHRKGITMDEWKHPKRTLAWIDLLTLANWENGIVTASYGFLATRWRVSKDTSYSWVKHWIAERQIERLTERSTERNAERFFIVNYAKYQGFTERVTERLTERSTERLAEQRYKVSSSKLLELSNKEYMSDESNIISDELNIFVSWLERSNIFSGGKKVITEKARRKWKTRRSKYSAREITEAFANLVNEPDKWKINNNGHQPLAWWLDSDDRIESMKSCHLKKITNAKTRNTSLISL